jgi:hypothetical protein
VPRYYKWNFLGGQAGFTSSDRVEVRITEEDAEKFKKTKSEKVRQKIIDQYVFPVSGTDKYVFPNGAFLGNMAVSAVLEINNVGAKK